MILLVRHGQTTTNAQRLLVGRSDPALTELGERQARALVPLLEGVEEVWSSPLTRARTTAALAVPHLEAQVRGSFIEVDYGSLDGTSVAALTEEMWREFEADHGLAFGGGESLAEVDVRVHEELDALLADRTSAVHDPERHLVIVSHASPIKSAVAWALGVHGSTAWRTRLDNGSVTAITARAGSPRLVRYNVVPAIEG